MFEIINFGGMWLNTFRDAGEWLFQEVGTLSSLLGEFGNRYLELVSRISPTAGEILQGVFNINILPFDTVAGLLVGSGFTFILGYKIVKFFIDMFF